MGKSFADEAEFAAFIGRDDFLRKMTTDAVATALEGFTMPLQEGRDLEWLAMATRRALAITMRHISDSPERTSNAEIRAELERLAAIAQSAWRELFECDHAAESRLWDYGWRHGDGEGGIDIGDGMVMGEPSMHVRFKAAVRELDWVAGFLRDAARETESQRGPWRQSEQRSLRIERARYLAPVFEAAFGQPVSANNWPGDALHKSRTPFMEFYQRAVAIAFGEKATPDISGVLKAGCKLHREYPVQFVEGTIPGL